MWDRWQRGESLSAIGREIIVYIGPDFALWRDPSGAAASFAAGADAR